MDDNPKNQRLKITCWRNMREFCLSHKNMAWVIVNEDYKWLRTHALFQQLKLTIARSRSWAESGGTACPLQLPSQYRSCPPPTPPPAGLGWKATYMVTLTGRVEPVLSLVWWLAGRRMTRTTVAYLLAPVPPPARVIMNVFCSYILPKKLSISCLFYPIRERNMFLFCCC